MRFFSVFRAKNVTLCGVNLTCYELIALIIFWLNRNEDEFSNEKEKLYSLSMHGRIIIYACNGPFNLSLWDGDGSFRNDCNKVHAKVLFLIRMSSGETFSFQAM
jgi:hypothetical protein